MSVSFKDYYAVLGVPRDAAPEAIQRAYRMLARKHHPDVDKSAGATKRFQELQEAYEVLKDPQKRARYDQLGANWKEGQSFTPPPGFEGAFHRRAHAGGRGFEFEDLSGFSEFFESLFGDLGARSGARPHAGGARRVRVEPDEEELEGDLDLHARLDIAPWDAALGGKVPFRHVDGSEVLLTIPAGSSSGRELRLRGLGRPRRDGRRGDLYVELRIVVHEALDEAERRLWRELAQRARSRPRA